MSNQNDRDKEIRKDLYKLQSGSQERYMKFLGIDVDKLRVMEREIDNDFGELAAKLQEFRREDGKARAERHAKLLRAGQADLTADAENALHADLSTVNAVLTHLRLDRIDPRIFTPLWFCHCHYTAWLFNDVGHGNDIIIDPPGSARVTATVEHESELCKAQPYVEVRSAEAGTSNSGQVKTFCKFAFTPVVDGVYCIRPFVAMSGWWLLWTWRGCGTTGDEGQGTIRITARVRVDQLSSPVGEREHVVLERHHAGPANDEGAVDYVSTMDNGTDISVYLHGGHEAVIFVECDVYAQIGNHGRAIVDMQSGNNFYFQVLPVAIGRRHCHWPWPLDVIIPQPALPFPLPSR